MTPAEATTLIKALRTIVGEAQVLADASEMSAYLLDWRGRYQGAALCVVRPATTDEVARVVAACATADVAIVPQGGNTGLVGGGVPCNSTHDVPAQVVVSLTRMNRIRDIDLDNNTLTVDAGCILRVVQEAAQAAGRLFPLALASEGSATIGGNLSTNAGGVQVLRYGNMRDLTLGLEVVLADGRVWNGLRGLRKDNTGYDLKQLFIGAEGTLGLITAAVLKLYPQPHLRVTAWLAVPDPQVAVTLLGRLRARCGERVNAFEIINRAAFELVLRHIPDTRAPLQGAHDWQILLELTDTHDHETGALLEVLTEFLAAETQNGRVLDAVIAQNEAQAQTLWRLRESISEAQKRDGFSIKHDVSLPVSRIAEFIERAGQQMEIGYPGVRMVCFGHIGDGNLHYNPSQPSVQENEAFMAASAQVNRIVHDLVDALGGSLSAEHGLGQLKRDEIRRYKSPLEMELMQTIKHALDPQCRMNPGKLL
ncbi:MAG: FAD-binding oxidoreductase [Sterolibacterium sp.]|jgi:FAD/FMN-containing dehydrogenase|nr:FAD-binding oxidoreductase [Sterolibacterium sp.]